MTHDEHVNDEILLQALDQLSAHSALSKSDWSVTTAALRSLERLLTLVSFGTSHQADTDVPRDLVFPDESEPEYLWFLKIQDSFECNCATQLLTFLRRLTAGDDLHSQILAWIPQTLYLIQGCLLLHEPSRFIFSRRPHMASLLYCLGHQFPEDVQVEAIQTLVSALVDRPHNLRVFEAVGGLEDISRLFLHSATGHRVKVKLLEFLYFYLMPEMTETVLHGETVTEDAVEAAAGAGSTTSTVMIKQHSRQPAEHDISSNDRTGPGTRTTEEKQALLGRYFNNIDALVDDLNEFKPFGDF